MQALNNEIDFSLHIPTITVKRWKLEITDAEDKLVKTFSGETRPEETLKWDVCDDKGKPLKSGNYKYRLTIVYQNGKEWIDKGQIIFPGFSSAKYTQGNKG